MKKSNVLIAAAAILISAATFAKAEEIKIDFDGHNVKSEEVKVNLDEKHGDMAFAQLNAQSQAVPGAVELDIIPGRMAPVFTDAMVTDMDKSIGSAIAYVNAHKQGAYLSAGLDCLMRNGTPEQKFAFVYKTTGAMYSFPDACSLQDNKSVASVCSWVFDTVCNTVTYVACAIMADGSKECHDEAKEDCRVVKNLVCTAE